MEPQEQFTPKIATSAIPNQYTSGIPINPLIAPNPQLGPSSAYYSPSKEQRQKEAEETLKQCPKETISYFLHRSPEKSKGPMPDYAKFLTEEPITAGHIEQPVQEPPIFVPAYPPQNARTPGLPIRYDHYVEVGQAPERTQPKKFPPGF